MRILFYISGHGFGHASRTLQVVNAVRRLEPTARIALRTSVAPWFLEASLQSRVDILPGVIDTGMVQPDSLSIDEDESARRAAAFYATFDERVAVERDLIRREGATLVVGDIPPIAFAAAADANVPSIAFGNFTWDWIYSAYPAFDTLAPGVCALIADADRRASLALRLPFAGGFASMANIVDVPLVARRATVSREDTRRRLGLADDRPVVLATFGGHGSHVPLDRAAADGRFLLVATDYEMRGQHQSTPNLRVVQASELDENGLTYTDLLASSDVVATKLGYGIVSECLANDVALLYTLRGRFIEQDVFMREMPAVMRSRYIDREPLLGGRWADDVEALLRQPKPSHAATEDGAPIVAAQLLEF